jgi:hypothetical protein
MTAYLRFSRHSREDGSPTRTGGTSPSGAFVRLARWSKTAGAGGIGSMRQGIGYLRAWRRQHERPRKACELILLPSHGGSTGILVEPLEVYFPR